MPPNISVIIPAHNEEKYIRQTLHSLKNQTYQNFEVIVVTNGCTDKTEEIVKKKVDERFRHLSLPKANVSVARNAGALNAQGKMLVFLDADTQLAPDSLEKIRHDFADAHAVATTRVQPDDSRFQYKAVMGLKNWNHTLGWYKGFSGILICRKEQFHQVNGYDPEVTIREHRALRQKLMALGEYACINTVVTTSTRRFQKWGLGKMAWFWISQWTRAKEDLKSDLQGKAYEHIR